MGSDRATYAEGILKVCGFCLRAPVDCVAGVASSNLSQRVEHIMTRATANEVRLSTRLLIGCVGMLVVSAPLATGVLSAHRASAGKTIGSTIGVAQGAAQETPQVYRPGNGVSAPKLVQDVKPEYTKEARAAHIQGGVTLEVVVLENGLVGDVNVVRSLDDVYGLDKAAVKAVKQWRFEPGTKDKKPVAVRVQVEMTFKLR